MGAETKIEWCDHTFNPWIGCTRVSPGCANCYAAEQDKFRKWTPEGFGAGKPRRHASVSYMKQALRWNNNQRYISEADAIVGQVYRPRVFCGSMCDWLDDEVPYEWTGELLSTIRQCQNLDWILLTKRPQLWTGRIQTLLVCGLQEGWLTKEDHAWLGGWFYGSKVPANVHIGVTVENQKTAVLRIPLLCAIPAATRFLSCEPMLEPIDLQLGKSEGFPTDNEPLRERQHLIHQVICGEESGRNARPMNLQWARDLRDQCKQADVPFFFKQRFESGVKYEDLDGEIIQQFPSTNK